MSSRDEAGALAYRRPETPQLDRIERMLGEIRDLLKARSAPLPVVPYEQVAGMMGKPHTETAPPYQRDPPAQAWMNSPVMGAGITVDASASQPWTPAPGKAGPAWCYPNPALTPGKANPQVTQETIATTIAVSGWTATVRPPVSITSVIKAHIMARDGLTGDPSQWELDHWWPICAGGAVCDMDNFWCMPYAPYPGAREKDRVEVFLQHQIIAGKMTLEAAHQALNDDWFALFIDLHKMGLMPMMVAYDPDGSSDPDDNA